MKRTTKRETAAERDLRLLAEADSSAYVTEFEGRSVIMFADHRGYDEVAARILNRLSRKGRR